MSLDPHTRRHRDLLEPATKGEWSLPAELSEAYATVQRLNDSLARLDLPDEPLHEHVRAALTDPSPHTMDISRLVDHDRTTREFEMRTEVLTRALREADDTVIRCIGRHREAIITEHLAPAGEQLWAEIVAAVDKLDDLPIGVPGVVHATDAQRDAYLLLDSGTGYGASYGRLRNAWSIIVGEPSDLDYDSHHAEFRDGLCALWPNRTRGWASQRTTPPWPEEPRERLVWLVRNGYTPWWPTRAQQDEAWRSVHGHAEAGFTVRTGANGEWDRD